MSRCFHRRNLEINTKKRKIIVCTEQDEVGIPQVKLNGEESEEMELLKYLRMGLSTYEKAEGKMKERIWEGGRMLRICGSR